MRDVILVKPMLLWDKNKKVSLFSNFELLHSEILPDVIKNKIRHLIADGQDRAERTGNDGYLVAGFYFAKKLNQFVQVYKTEIGE